MSMTSEGLRAEKLPEAETRRRLPRQALGRGLGILLLQGQLRAAAAAAPLLRVPVWAESFEPRHQQWLRKVWSRSWGR
jgi:hypothetical protein